jgi:hypothetical protein
MASIARAMKGDKAAAMIFNLAMKLLEPDAESDDAAVRPSADQEIVKAFLERHLTPAEGDAQ